MSGSTFRVGMTVRAALAVTLIALAVGVAGVRAATAGWQGESIISSPATGDGWEPAIAADPSAPYVYTAWMQYSGPSITISQRTSTDGGSTWGAVKPLCASCGKGQYDVTLASSSTGAVYATYMQGNRISFTRSTDHAATWSAPIKISAGTWADKPWMTTSANGQDVYVMWASHGNVDATSSHDAGLTFSTPVQITNESNIYYYPNGGTVLPNGTAEIVASEYPEKGNNTKITGPINIVAFRSTNARQQLAANGGGYAQHRGNVRDLVGYHGRLGRLRYTGAPVQRVDQRGCERQGVRPPLDRFRCHLERAS